MLKEDHILVKEVDVTTWKQDIDSFETGLFNSWQWVSSLVNEYTSDLYLEFVIDDEVIAKLAGIKLNKGKKRGVHLYFISGPAMKKQEAKLFSSVLTALRSYAISNKFARVHIRPFEPCIGSGQKVKHYFDTTANEYVVFYADYTERVKLSYGFKQNAKKARKAGAKYGTSRSVEMLDRLLELLGETRETRKSKYGNDYNPLYMLNLSRESLKRLLETEVGLMHYAEIDGQIHSVQFNLEDDKRIFALLMGSDDTAYKVGIPSFIDLNITTNALENGYEYYNMGTVPLEKDGGGGLKRYKMSQGAREVIRYGYYTYFLVYPYKLLNPFMRISKKLPHNSFFNLLRKITNFFNFSV